MRKIYFLMVILLLSCVFKSESYAQNANASPAVVGVNQAVTYKNITFPYPTRDLNIINNDSADKVWVDVSGGTNTTDKSQCILLDAGDSLDLYNYITDGISLFYDDEYSTGYEASPISILATY